MVPFGAQGMSLLDILQLVGHGTGATITLWMSALLTRRKHLRSVEKTLIALGITIGTWHICNFATSLHGFLGLDQTRWLLLLRTVDSIAVIAITFAYSILLHVHLYLWADSRSRPLMRTEKLRIYLSYIPTIFLFVALPNVWQGTYQPMLEKFGNTLLPGLPYLSFLVAFSLWAAYVLCLVAGTDLLMAKLAESPSERRFLVFMAVSFLAVGALVFIHGALGIGAGTTVSEYLKIIVNLGSILPAGLIVYYIYRYRYLELVIRDSLVLASFSVVVLTFYLVLVRSVGAWLTARYQLRSGAVESMFILGLALLAAPLKSWLDGRFHKMFEREASLYRDVMSRISETKGHYQNLADLLGFIEEKATANLGMRRVKIAASHLLAEGGKLYGTKEVPALEVVTRLITESDGRWLSGEVAKVISEFGFDYAITLRREGRAVGMLFIACAEDVLTPGVRAVIDVVAGQIAIAIEDSLIVEQNVKLERRLAQGERLAELGQMAATVAHEVKNPLSAIKSIAQVMREDTAVALEYGRDLDLIVGETDRLNQSVSQLLSFAKTSRDGGSKLNADGLVRLVGEICKTDANSRAIELQFLIESTFLFSSVVGAAVKDALTNLTLNAIHATPDGGIVKIHVRRDLRGLILSVEDSGQGVNKAIREQIWEPFFTTKQRGTGLGLAIVQKRMSEAGGYAVLSDSSSLGGARFELHIPDDGANEKGNLTNGNGKSQL